MINEKVIGKQTYTELLATADPENIASIKLLQHSGFEKTKLKKGIYARYSLGGERKSDLQFFALRRPGYTGVLDLRIK